LRAGQSPSLACKRPQPLSDSRGCTDGKDHIDKNTPRWHLPAAPFSQQSLQLVAGACRDLPTNHYVQMGTTHWITASSQPQAGQPGCCNRWRPQPTILNHVDNNHTADHCTVPGNGVCIDLMLQQPILHYWRLALPSDFDTPGDYLPAMKCTAGLGARLN
jgi:hypothetical protein